MNSVILNHLRFFLDLDFFLALEMGGLEDLRYLRDLLDGDSLEAEDDDEPELDDEDDWCLFLLEAVFRPRSLDEDRDRD